jgi:hypothetical protein
MNEVTVQRLDISIQNDSTGLNEISQVKCELMLRCQSFDHAHHIAKILKSVINSKIVEKDTGKYQGEFMEDV